MSTLLETDRAHGHLRRPATPTTASTSPCREGKLVGLIGPNGAGKTTFIDAITGFTKPSEGSVHFDGEDITGLQHPRPGSARASRGTWQSLELFEDLTVRDNLLVAAERPKWWSFLTDMRAPRPLRRPSTSSVDWALTQVGLSDVRDTLPGELPHGHRKLIGVARALVAEPQARAARRAGRRPRLGREPRARPPAPRPARRRHHRLPHRPRHGPRAQRLRLPVRARLRRGHRRGHAGADPRPTPTSSPPTSARAPATPQAHGARSDRRRRTRRSRSQIEEHSEHGAATS